MCILMLLDEMFYNCQLDQVDKMTLFSFSISLLISVHCSIDYREVSYIHGFHII